MIIVVYNPVDYAMIAEDNVLAIPSGHSIGTGIVITSKDQVITGQTMNGVVAAYSWIDRKDQAMIADDTIGLITGSALTQDGDEFSACCIDVMYSTAITEDNVVIGTAGNYVIALTAKDNQRQARSTGIYGIGIAIGNT